MEFLCKLCDRSIIENEIEYYEYLTTLRKKYNESFKNITIINVDLDEVKKILNDYISILNKKFRFLFYQL